MIGLALALGSTATFASADLKASFTNEDMIQTDATYSYTLESVDFVKASVIEVDIAVEGSGLLSSQLVSTCTQWQGTLCVGPYKNIWHSEFLHEVEVSLKCDGQSVYQLTKNNAELSNEEIFDKKSAITFDYSQIKLTPISCKNLQVDVRTIQGASDAIIKGVVRLTNSTSTPSSLKYGVSL